MNKNSTPTTASNPHSRGHSAATARPNQMGNRNSANKTNLFAKNTKPSLQQGVNSNRNSSERAGAKPRPQRRFSATRVNNQGTPMIVLFNKPFDVLCQFTDEQGRKTLKDYIPIPGVYAAGRLDRDSEGLLLLTNDGQLQAKLTEPKKKTFKTYWVQVEGQPSEADLVKLRQGVELKDGQGLKEAAVQLKLDKGTDLNQQASMAYLRLSELKESETALGNQVNELLQRHNLLPSVIANARQNVLQNKKTELAPIDTPTGELQQTQRIFFEQSLATHEAELASSQKRIELTQLQLQLVRQQLSQQEAFIETINKVINKQRQRQTDATLAKNLVDTAKVVDPVTRNIADTNQIYGQKLQTLTLQINNVVEQQEQAELQYQSQAKQLANIQEQITWVKMNSAFGERFLQMLQSLPKPPNHEKLQTLIADARLDRYHLEQQQALNEQELEQTNRYSEGQIKLLRSQQALLTQLMQSYDQYLSELGKLKVNYQQLSQQHLTLKNTLNEHLFWVPNAASINKLWLTDVQRSALWLIQEAQWGQLGKA